VLLGWGFALKLRELHSVVIEGNVGMKVYKILNIPTAKLKQFLQMNYQGLSI
jgi:hypothetical protein